MQKSRMAREWMLPHEVAREFKVTVRRAVHCRERRIVPAAEQLEINVFAK